MARQGGSNSPSLTAVPDPETTPTIEHNPSFEQLRAYSSQLETTTEYGSPSYVSAQRSRAADRTRNNIDHDFDPEDYGYIQDAISAIDSREMVCVDRRMGRHPDHSYICRLYVPKAYSRIALAWAKLFEPVASPREPDFVTLQLPDWPNLAIRALPETGLTVVLGSDYTGEAKKSFLRLFMYTVKQAGGLGLHAGTKRVTVERDGRLTDVGQVFLGLSATGKSTLTAHDLWFDSPEEAVMLQDDVCGLLPDGAVCGSEGNGLYVKTNGLDGTDQPAVYDAVTHESAVLENVDVAPDGTVDFESTKYTSNGRAVISRKQLASAGDAIDLDSVDQVFFITRQPLMPPVAKLSPDEAAAAFMLGESIETSAGDPDRAGESIRVVGTNPFIIGSPGEEGNRFRELIASLDVECFLLNTGYLGDEAKDIGVDVSVTLLRELARGTVTWTTESATGLVVPSHVPGLDMSEYDVAAYVDGYDDARQALRAERREYLDQFDALDDAIRDAVY